MPRQNDRSGTAVADTFRPRARAGDDGDLALEAVISADCRHGFPRICCCTIPAMPWPRQRANNHECRRKSLRPTWNVRSEPNSKAQKGIAASALQSWQKLQI